jgi:hypothetical protein
MECSSSENKTETYLLNNSFVLVAGSIPYEVIFFNFPDPSVRSGPGVYSDSNRNEYQKRKNKNVSGAAAGA